jgi:hypothetical protein
MVFWAILVSAKPCRAARSQAFADTSFVWIARNPLVTELLDLTALQTSNIQFPLAFLV